MSWDALETVQRNFIDTLTTPDLSCRGLREHRGQSFRLALWPLLQHVANHATHHRSEIATIMTMLNGSPPPTDLVLYHLIQSGQTPS